MATLQMYVYKGLSLSNYCHVVLIVMLIPLIYHDIVLQLSCPRVWLEFESLQPLPTINYFIIFEQIHLTKKKYPHTQRPIRLKNFEFENKTSNIILLNSWGQYEYEFKKTLLGFMTSCPSLMFWVICPKSSHRDFLALYTRSI